MFEHDEVIITSDNKIGQRSWNFPVRRVVVPDFQIYSNPTINISDIKKRRFSLIDRYVDKAKRQIMAQEDENIFKALDDLGSGNNDI